MPWTSCLKEAVRQWRCVTGACAIIASACGSAQEVDVSTLNQDVEAALLSASTSYEPELGKGVDDAQTRTFMKCVVFPSVETKPGPGFKHQ